MTFIATQVSFSDPSFTNAHAAPKDLHLYSEQGVFASLHNSQLSPPFGATHGPHVTVYVIVVSLSNPYSTTKYIAAATVITFIATVNVLLLPILSHFPGTGKAEPKKQPSSSNVLAAPFASLIVPNPDLAALIGLESFFSSAYIGASKVVLKLPEREYLEVEEELLGNFNSAFESVDLASSPARGLSLFSFFPH